MAGNTEMEQLQIALSFLQQVKIKIEHLSTKSEQKLMIRHQKQLCISLARLFKIVRYFGQHSQQLQTRKLAQAILCIFNNICEDKQTGIEDLQKYHYLFNKFQFLSHKLQQMVDSQNNKLLMNPNIEQRNKIIAIFREEIQPVSPEGIYKNTTLAFQGFHVSKLQDQTIITSSIQLIKNKQYNLPFAKMMCQMMNKCDGVALFVGLDDKNRVEGIQLTDNECRQIKQNIMKVRKQMIFPKISVMQKFSINFIKVENILNPKTIKKHNKYIIKIYIKTRSIGKCYFVQEPTKQDKKVYTYGIYNGDNLVIPQKLYQEITKKVKERTVVLEFIKKNITQYFQVTQGGASEDVAGGKVTVEKQEKSKIQKTNNDYGRLPQKRFAYHSIIVISAGQKARQKFNQLLEFMKDESEYFLYNQIYEKMNKTNNRLIYYMTHRKNPEDLLNFCTKIDKDRKYLVFNKIKPQLSLLRNSFIYSAVQTGKARYENHFGEPLKIVYKRSEQNKNTNQYFFIFDTQQEAIFVFCLLEYANIRTNFANQKKTEDTIPVEPDHLQALLDPKNKA